MSVSTVPTAAVTPGLVEVITAADAAGRDQAIETV
jgi:hypothetical protein